MAAVRFLLGRCGLVETSDQALNDIVQEEEPTRTSTPVSRASSLTSQLSCIAPSKKYQPEETNNDISLMLEKDVPGLLACISSPLPDPKERSAHIQSKKRKSDSLKMLHDLTKKGKEFNRIPLVASNKWDIVGVLSRALMEIQDETNESKPEVNQDRRLVCWTLNNLSIPYENKAIMIECEASSMLFGALGDVIRRNLPSSYLCIICYMNLTFLAEAIEPVAYYILPTSAKADDTNLKGPPSLRPTSVGNMPEKSLRLLDNPASLLRVLERMMLTNSPFLLSSVSSVQGEAIRWACGLIRNITYANQYADKTFSNSQMSVSLSDSSGRQGSIDNSVIEEICTMISATEIPRLIVAYVRDSPNPAVKWTKDSLEDICLGILCQLVIWPSSRYSLLRAGAAQSLEQVEGLPGIHGYRARAIRCSLGELPKQFGN